MVTCPPLEPQFKSGQVLASEAGMPSNKKLQEVLRSELIEIGNSVPENTTLPELATAVEKSVGRSRLIGIIQNLFDDALKEHPWEQGAYPWIPYLPSDLVRVIYTTNFDDLLKRSFEAAGQVAREIRSSDNLPRAGLFDVGQQHATLRLSTVGPLLPPGGRRCRTGDRGKEDRFAAGRLRSVSRPGLRGAGRRGCLYHQNLSCFVQA